MLDIKTQEASIKIDVFNFASVDDVQSEVLVDYNLFSCSGQLELKSIWLYWSGIQRFYTDITRIVAGESIPASLADMSQEFKLTISRNELEALVTILFKLPPSRVELSLELNCEFDILNVIQRQLADFSRQAGVSIINYR